MNYFKRKKTLNTGNPPRESGHYWVRWGLLANTPRGAAVWRMGAYQSHVGWKLPGEERLYQDNDFIEINEARIPFTTGQLYKGFWHWVAIAANLIAAGYYIFYLLTHR